MFSSRIVITNIFNKKSNILIFYNIGTINDSETRFGQQKTRGKYCTELNRLYKLLVATIYRIGRVFQHIISVITAANNTINVEVPHWLNNSRSGRRLGGTTLWSYRRTRFCTVIKNHNRVQISLYDYFLVIHPALILRGSQEERGNQRIYIEQKWIRNCKKDYQTDDHEQIQLFL